MGDPLNHVSPGQPLQIRASTYNSFCDAAKAIQQSRMLEMSSPNFIRRESGLISVQNDSGANLPEFSVIGLSDPLPTPTDNENEFMTHPSFSAVTPAIANHMLRYAITQEPIAHDAVNPKMGKCLVSGFTVCKVKVIKAWHKCAIIVDGEIGYLESASAGDAIIHYAAGTPGGSADWALVTLKSGEANVLWGKSLTNWNKAAGNASYVNIHPCEDLTGADEDVDTEVKIWLPRNGFDLDPNIVADAIIPYILTTPENDPQEGVCIGDYLDGKIDVSFKLIASTESDPDGWQVVADANAKALVMNNDAPETGYDTHGSGTNDHATHASHSLDLAHVVNDNLTFTPSLSSHKFPHWDSIGPYETNLDDVLTGEGIDVSGVGNQVLAEGGDITGDITVDNHTDELAHDGHSETSNWPPWYKVKLIRRIDNSHGV